MRSYLKILTHTHLFNGVSEEKISMMLNCLEAKVTAYKKGDYVLALKGNKGTLYEDVVDYFDEKTIEQIIAKNELYKKQKISHIVV